MRSYSQEHKNILRWESKSRTFLERKKLFRKISKICFHAWEVCGFLSIPFLLVWLLRQFGLARIKKKIRQCDNITRRPFLVNGMIPHGCMNKPLENKISTFTIIKLIVLMNFAFLCFKKSLFTYFFKLISLKLVSSEIT